MTDAATWGVALRTQLRCRVGEKLAGAGGGSRSFTPRAAALLATRNCQSFESWEQIRGFVEQSALAVGTGGRRELWQLVRDDEADAWLDYDHGTGELVLLEPIETSRPVGDPEFLVPGTRVVIDQEGRSRDAECVRRGFARVTETSGRFATPLGRGDAFEYADLADWSGRLVHVRRTTNRLGSTTIVYEGRTLGVGEQMDLFGRRLSGAPARGIATASRATTSSSSSSSSSRGEDKLNDWFTTRFIPTSIVLLLMLLGSLLKNLQP